MAPSENEKHDIIRQRIQDNAAFSSSYVTMNVLSAIIASYGLLTNSSAVIIGAMIVAMLLGPLMGIALALVDADNSLLKKSLLAEIGGAIVVVAISLIIGKIHQDIPLERSIISRTSPNITDLIIALAGGAAGAYATISPRVSASLVGVAVATALVPPLCACGITLARGEKQLALGGFLLFITNLVAIQVASSLVFALHGYHDITKLVTNRRRILLILHGPSILLLIILIVVLGINFNDSLSKRKFEVKVRNIINQELENRPGSYMADMRIDEINHKTAITAVVRTPYSIEPEQVAAIQTKMPEHKPPIDLHIRSIITKEASPHGWLHLSPEPQMQIEPGLDNNK